jgi:hypothetical protein
VTGVSRYGDMLNKTTLTEPNDNPQRVAARFPLSDGKTLIFLASLGGQED